MTNFSQEEKLTDSQKNGPIAAGSIRKAVANYFSKRSSLKDKHYSQDMKENVSVIGLRERISAMCHAEKHKDKEVRLNYTYPKEYRGLKSISKLVDLTAKTFDLSPVYTNEWIKKVLPTLTLPLGAEGWCALPSVDAVAKSHFPEVTDPSEKYCRAVELVLEKLDRSRTFYNYREGEITPKQLRQHVHTVKAFKQITEKQLGDILIIPVNYGKLHRDHSTLCTHERFHENKFELGAFAVGAMALCHPERHVRWEQLHTSCVGDEFAPVADGNFSEFPIFRFFGDGLGFSTSDISLDYGRCRPVSGFLVQ